MPSPPAEPAPGQTEKPSPSPKTKLTGKVKNIKKKPDSPESDTIDKKDKDKNDY